MNEIAAIGINPVATQPTIDQLAEALNCPRMSARVAIIINSAITGTATMPLITAAQTRACTGLSAATLAPAPRSVATAMAA